MRIEFLFSCPTWPHLFLLSFLLHSLSILWTSPFILLTPFVSLLCVLHKESIENKTHNSVSEMLSPFNDIFLAHNKFNLSFRLHFSRERKKYFISFRKRIKNRTFRGYPTKLSLKPLFESISIWKLQIVMKAAKEWLKENCQFNVKRKIWKIILNFSAWRGGTEMESVFVQPFRASPDFSSLMTCELSFPLLIVIHSLNSATTFLLSVSWVLKM